MHVSKTALVALLAVAGCADQATSIKSLADYRAEAAAVVDGISAADSTALLDSDAVVFIDVREEDELARLGRIEGAVHVPRGILEFRIDPNSTLHLEVFRSDKKVIFYCATGGRSLLAAKLARDMGVADPVYLEGGFSAWQRAGGAITGNGN